jgi:hypothetical protein
MAVSFSTDIQPLFTEMDVDHMKAQGVPLDDYSWMSQPDNAAQVFQAVSSGWMPPSDSGEQRWPADRVALFKSWMDGGYQP